MLPLGEMFNGSSIPLLTLIINVIVVASGAVWIVGSVRTQTAELRTTAEHLTKTTDLLINRFVDIHDSLKDARERLQGVESRCEMHRERTVKLESIIAACPACGKSLPQITG